MDEKLREVLQHVDAGGDLQDIGGTKHEMAALVTTASKRGLVAWGKARGRYELTAAGRKRLSGFAPRDPSGAKGLLSAKLIAATLGGAGLAAAVLAAIWPWGEAYSGPSVEPEISRRLGGRVGPCGEARGPGASRRSCAGRARLARVFDLGARDGIGCPKGPRNGNRTRGPDSTCGPEDRRGSRKHDVRRNAARGCRGLGCPEGPCNGTRTGSISLTRDPGGTGSIRGAGNSGCRRAAARHHGCRHAFPLWQRRGRAGKCRKPASARRQ